jgi:acyl-CoA thioesterase I
MKTIVFIGDSVTDCDRLTIPPYGNGYVSLIAASKEINSPVINVGTSGNRLIDLEKRWREDVLENKPEILSIAIGVNDTWRRYDDNDVTDVVEFENRYRSLLAITRSECNSKFVLCEPFLLPVREEMVLWREDLDPKIDVVHRLAREFDALLIPYDAQFTKLAALSTMGELAEDGIHPTRAGHALMAKLWLDTVRSYL